VADRFCDYSHLKTDERMETLSYDHLFGGNCTEVCAVKIQFARIVGGEQACSG
jgi:hypothetical protein